MQFLELLFNLLFFWIVLSKLYFEILMLRIGTTVNTERAPYLIYEKLRFSY